jgi:hypothetical protein
MQREVLWTLEEAGFETVETVLNTVRQHHLFSDLDPAPFAAEIESAIRGLLRAGLISFCRYLPPPVARWTDIPEEDTSRSLVLADLVQWDEDRGCWTANVDVSLCLTDAGIQAIWE